MAIMGDDAALTELAGVAELQTEASYAWALDYDDYAERARRFTPRRITEAALAASLVLIAAAGGVALLSIRGVWHIDLDEPAVGEPTVSATVSVTALPPSTTPAARPPVAGPWITPTKPVTVTVQAPPPPLPPPVQRPPPPQFTVYDQQFLQSMQQKWGWRIDDPGLMIQNASLVCVELQQGQDLPEISQELAARTATDVSSAHVFASEVLLIYPACHA